MYCRNCANEVSEKAIACPKCGVNPLAENKFCPSCAAVTNENQVICTQCGTSLSRNSHVDNGKAVAIVAHITIIGWIIAVVMNSQNRTEFGSFYIRQALGIFLMFIVFLFIPGVNCVAAPLFLITLLVSFVFSLGDTMKPLPVVGHLFQEWFKGI
jgi:RNA polymerase subunit RPABC4/transcription elongation factor Spt4